MTQGCAMTPGSGLVRRCAVSVPSARCQKIAEVPLAIRLERDPLTIRRPDRKSIPSSEGQLPNRALVREIVDPDVRPGLRPRCPARRASRRGRCVATWYAPAGIFSCSMAPGRSLNASSVVRGQTGGGTGNVDERAGIGDAEVGHPCLGAVRSPDAFDDGNAAAAERQPSGVEWRGEQQSALRIHKVSGGQIPGVTSAVDDDAALAGLQTTAQRSARCPTFPRRSVVASVKSRVSPSGSSSGPYASSPVLTLTICFRLSTARPTPSESRCLPWPTRMPSASPAHAEGTVGPAHA